MDSLIPKRRIDVARWLQTDDFEVVCEIAGCNDEILYREIKKILLSKWPVNKVLAAKLKAALVYEAQEESQCLTLSTL